LLFGLKPSRVQEALERLEQVSWIGEVGPAKEASIEVVSRRGSTEAALTRRRR
jgi:hypothetical protein